MSNVTIRFCENLYNHQFRNKTMPLCDTVTLTIINDKSVLAKYILSTHISQSQVTVKCNNKFISN